MTKLLSSIVLLAISIVTPNLEPVVEAPIQPNEAIIEIAEPIVTSPPPTDEIKGYAYKKIVARWGEHEWEHFEWLMQKESRWNPCAFNPGQSDCEVPTPDTACGIPQALPCDKMGLEDWTDYQGQLDWVIDTYIPERYTTPSLARQFWIAQATDPLNPTDGWY